MLKQEKGYGCGLYAVANVLDLKDFITPQRLEKSKKGVTRFELSKYLQEDNINLYIDVLYCDTFKDKLPNEWCLLRPTGNNNCIPILVQCIIHENYHLMGAKLFQTGHVMLFDSMKKTSIICTLEEINAMYEKVVGLYSFNHLDTADYLFLF